MVKALSPFVCYTLCALEEAFPPVCDDIQNLCTGTLTIPFDTGDYAKLKILL